MKFDTTREHPRNTVGWLIGADEELLVYSTACANPGCECDEVFAEVAANDPNGGLGPALATVQFGPDGVGTGSGRPDLIAELRALPRWVTDDARQRKKTRREESLHQEAFRIPKRTLRSRDLVCWLDYESPMGSLFNEGTTYMYIADGEASYGVDLAFCPRPDCDCREVLLRIARLTEEAGTLEIEELGAVTLDPHARPCWETYSGDVGLAKRIFEAWSAQIPDVAKLVGERIETLKEVAQRPSLTKTRRRPARNAPCPCGSGKRYKGCCGRQ